LIEAIAACERFGTPIRLIARNASSDTALFFGVQDSPESRILQSYFGEFWKFWRILENFGEFWEEFLGNPGNVVSVDNTFQNSSNPKFWRILGNPGEFWEFFGESWEVFWILGIYFGNYWRILGNPEIFWGILVSFLESSGKFFTRILESSGSHFGKILGEFWVIFSQKEFHVVNRKFKNKCS